MPFVNLTAHLKSDFLLLFLIKSCLAYSAISDDNHDKCAIFREASLFIYDQLL